MDWKEYTYYPQFSGNAIAYRPLVGVTVSHGIRRVVTTGLIDSGSDFTLINSEFTKELGIEGSGSERVLIGGIADKGTVSFISTVTLRIDRFEEAIEVAARFVPGLRVDVLLGESDFFEKFRIRFEKKRRRFYLAKER